MGQHLRMLLQALLISLGLHAILLFQPEEKADAGRLERSSGQARLDTRLLAAKARTSTMGTPGEELRPPTEASSEAKSPTKPQKMLPASAAVSSSFSPSAALIPAMPERPPSSPVASLNASGLPGQGVDVANVHEDTQSGLRRYRIALARATRQLRDYPQAAREAGNGGVVSLRLAAAGGKIPVVSLEESSGHADLDTAALNMLRRAVGWVGIPAGLLGEAFQMVIPVEFDPAAEKRRADDRPSP